MVGEAVYDTLVTLMEQRRRTTRLPHPSVRKR
jgi:hypothetical protein